MDLSVIPEVIGESLEGAARFTAGTGWNPLFPEPVKEFLDDHVPKVREYREEFRGEGLGQQAADAADFVTMLPVVGYAGTAVKAATTAKKAAKAKKAWDAEKALRNVRKTEALATNKRELKISKQAKRSFQKRGGGWDQRSAEVAKARKAKGLDPRDVSLRELDYIAEPLHNYRNQITVMRKINKGIKKGVKVANRHSQTRMQYQKLAKEATKKARPSRSAIAGSVYQMSKKKTKRY